MNLPFGFEIIKRGGQAVLRRPGRPHPVPAKAKRSFAAAQATDLTHSWTSTPESINEMLVAGLTSLRARSRDLAINSSHGAKFVKMVRGNVVGPNGIVLQARAQNKDGTLDRVANDAIETAFRDWGDSEFASMCGTLGWVDIQDLFVSSLVTDGEVIFRKMFGPGAGPWGYSLSQVDPSLLDVGYNADLPGDACVRMGIEIDGWHRPLAYHFREESAGVGSYWGANGYRYLRVPADQIIHKFVPEMVNQLRGVPWMAPSMLRMKMFSAFEEAAVINARLGASKVGIITTPAGDTYDGADAVDPATGDQLMDADPGTWLTASEGQVLSAWDPAYPNGEFADFSKSVLQSISAGFNVDYPSLSSNQEGTSYSSMRAGLVETREVWKKTQEWMIRGFVAPAYRDWLRMALLGDMITVGAAPLRIEREWKFRRVRFQGRRWPWVDPLKDLQAAKLAIDEGLASRTEVIMDRGRDPDEVWTEIERDNKRMDELGILVGDSAAMVPEVEDERIDDRKGE